MKPERSTDMEGGLRKRLESSLLKEYILIQAVSSPGYSSFKKSHKIHCNIRNEIKNI